MEVRVVRSAKRRKTVQARMVDGCLEVRIPSRMSAREEAHWVEVMQRRFDRQGDAERIDLARRARTLARRYDLPEPTSIRWVSNQRARWGSCSPWNGEIRISDRLAAWPTWVLDYVVVHELAHLRYTGHGPRFQALVDRYPRAERARGFLIAKSSDGGLAEDGDIDVGGAGDEDERRAPDGVIGDGAGERTPATPLDERPAAAAGVRGGRQGVAKQLDAPTLPFG